MISQKAALIRASLEPETVDPGWTLKAERQGWEELASGDQLAPGTTETGETIGGRPVLWIEPDGAEPARR